MRARICQWCGAVYGSREHHGVRFCSLACCHAAARSHAAARPVPEPSEVYREMREALARLARVVERS